jgi:hypothetical protein
VGRERDKTKGFIKTKSLKGEYRVSSLVKQKKKRKITLSFTSPEKEKCFFYL